MSTRDIAVSFPSSGTIRLETRSLFGDPDHPNCRKFLERVFHAREIEGITIDGTESPRADLHYCQRTFRLQEVVKVLTSLLVPNSAQRPFETLLHKTAEPNYLPTAESLNANDKPLRIAPSQTARDFRGVVRYYRHGSVVSGWKIVSELHGRLRLRNLVLLRRSPLCRAVERELTSVLGIGRFKTNPLTGTLLLHHDPRLLSRQQVIEILDAALIRVEPPATPDQPETNLPICTVSLPLAAAAQFAAPVLLPAAAALFVYSAVPTFKEARRILLEEKRIGVDALDSVVVVGCLGTMSIFPGAVCCWCLSFGRSLVKKTREKSSRMLLDAFGKQPRYAWLDREGVEVQVLAETLQRGDVIVVHTGDTVPVDGHIASGMAVIDQHTLTGESTPAEKGIGDRVFASTVLVGGKIHIAVEQSGQETASARITQILSDTAGYKLSSQHKGERLADKAVIPTLAVGALGMATMGPIGAVAVLNSDLGTGIRMAAPLAMLSSLSVCAHKGILVKDGRALEQISAVDTVLFDKTGTLTHERPEVGRIITTAGLSRERVLQLAAAAERKFHHPIAQAILGRAEELGLDLPPHDDTQYKVGYGITVHVEGQVIQVGSKRFMELEQIAIPVAIQVAIEEAHQDGSTMVLVSVNGRLGGAIELRAAVRAEARAIIRGLRNRGIKHIAIISGDHDAPTRKLAESLEMDRYFAQVLPADKADIVERLQKEGRKVCFVGDGINDSIALKKADVSISLRGASTIATDTAQVVFLEGGLAKLCELRDIACNLDRNVSRSWSMIVAPNVSNVIGVFTMGFGIMASVLTNNVAALAALANGLLPLRRVKDSPHEQTHGLRITPGEVAERDRLPLHPPLIARRPEIPDTRSDGSHTPAASA
jgi:heavy metal translocating P-type ATPase